MFRGTHLTDWTTKASKDARGIQARDRRELQRAILHHQLDGRSAKVYPCKRGGDRAQAGGAAEMHKTKQKFLERTSYYGQVVDFDGQAGC